MTETPDPAKVTTSAYDPLAGITKKTTREDMMGRLRAAADWIRRNDPEREKADRLFAIEARLRAKYAGHQMTYDVKQGVVSASGEEWRDSISFLQEFGDLLPPLLVRFVEGGQVLLGEHKSQKAEEAETVA